MVLFGLSAVRPDPALSTFGRRMRGLLPVAPVLTNRWSLAWLAIGLGGYAFAMGRFEGGGESRAVVWAWLIGIAALLISQWPSVSRSTMRVLPAERVYLLALAGLMVLALVMRVYRLTTLPLDLDGDFASHGLQARALATGQEPFLFKFGWANIPMIGFLPAALTMKVFGTGLAGLNAAGVIEGLGIILGVYLLGRQLAHPRVGLLAAALLTDLLHAPAFQPHLRVHRPGLLHGLCGLFPGAGPAARPGMGVRVERPGDRLRPADVLLRSHHAVDRGLRWPVFAYRATRPAGRPLARRTAVDLRLARRAWDRH